MAKLTFWSHTLEILKYHATEAAIWEVGTQHGDKYKSVQGDDMAIVKQSESKHLFLIINICDP